MIRDRPDGAVELDVHAVPKSSRDAIGEAHDGRLELHVRAAPVDGAANVALVRLLSKALGIPRRSIELVRGETGKRKTLRITGLPRAAVASKLGLELGLWLGLWLGLLALGASACSDGRELPITVILPADQSELQRADNASLVMRPSGDLFSFAVDGLDFRLELEGEPTTQLQQLELYLADGEELLAWGSTAEFATAAADADLALFLGRPGLLSTWPEALDAPDPDLLASEAIGRGMLLVQTDGDTFLLNHFTLLLEAGSRLPDTAGFPADDGGLFAAADGSVVRLAYEQVDPLAWRYDPSADSWTELEVEGAAELGPRPGAAALVTPDATRLFLLGGAGQTEGLAIDLLPSEGVLGSAPVADFALEDARDGATALWIPSADSPTADALLVGGLGEVGGSPSPLPVVSLASSGAASGPSSSWLDLACAIQREDPDLPAVTVLCLGGSIDGSPTADALSITVTPGQPELGVELHESFLPVALPDPLLFQDGFALYAQGEGRWLSIARTDASLTEPDAAPLRARGGHLVSVANGVTFLVGGVDQSGAPIDRWQVFTPAIEP